MLVTVWRHGEAGAAPRDEDRALTERGQLTVAMAAQQFSRWLADEGHPAVDRMFHSPLVRTTQTAQLLEAALGCSSEVCNPLAPGTRIDRPEDYVSQGDCHLVLVGHQPFVSQIIWHWLDDDKLDPLLPGGWATLQLQAPLQGGATLVKARPNIF